MESSPAYLPPSEIVVEVVAEAEDLEPVDLDPLYEVIDPDALNAVFRPTNTTRRDMGEVRFEYHGHTVVVTSNGSVKLPNTLTDIDAREVAERQRHE